MTYWPGTKIIKSQNNAFTLWKDGQLSVLTKKNSGAQQIHKGGYVLAKDKLNKKNSFTIYSKA